MRLVFVNPDSRGSALDATVSAHGRGPRPLVGNRRRRARLPRSTHVPPWPPGCLLGVDNGVTRALFFTLWVQVIQWAGRGTGRAFTPMGKKLPQRIPPGNGRVQGQVSPEAPPPDMEAMMLRFLRQPQGVGRVDIKEPKKGGQHARTGPARALRPSTLMSVAPPTLSGPDSEAQASILGFLLPVPPSTSEAAPPIRTQARSGHGFRRRSPAGATTNRPTWSLPCSSFSQWGWRYTSPSSTSTRSCPRG